MAVSKAKACGGIFLALALAAALFAGYIWAALHWSYSKGERAGYVQKISQKGWLIKTWEGELVLVAVPGSLPEKFYFTVHDDALARRINSVIGKRVALVYEQHKGLPANWFGDSEYFGKDLKIVE